jgi:hypothetical protein
MTIMVFLLRHASTAKLPDPQHLYPLGILDLIRRHAFQPDYKLTHGPEFAPMTRFKTGGQSPTLPVIPMGCFLEVFLSNEFQAKFIPAIHARLYAEWPSFGKILSIMEE